MLLAAVTVLFAPSSEPCDYATFGDASGEAFNDVVVLLCIRLLVVQRNN
jgi:hypothetical protein